MSLPIGGLPNKCSFNLLIQLQLMRFTILLFTICLFFTSNTTAQNVAKTITFNNVTIGAGSPYIGADPSVGDHEDFALLIDCPDNSLLFAGDWTATTDVTAAGTYNFGPIFTDCASPTWIIDPIDPALTVLNLNIETFESGDLDCDGPYNPGGVADDQHQEVSTSISFNIGVGAQSFTQPTTGITYNYTVTSAATTNTGLICGSDLSASTSSPEVPTLSEWGLIILALLLMTLGTLYLVQPISPREQI